MLLWTVMRTIWNPSFCERQHRGVCLKHQSFGRNMGTSGRRQETFTACKKRLHFFFSFFSNSVTVHSVKSFSDKSQSNPACLQRGKWGNLMTCCWAWLLLALTLTEWPSSRAKYFFPMPSGAAVGTKSLPWCLSIRQPLLPEGHALLPQHRSPST